MYVVVSLAVTIEVIVLSSKGFILGNFLHWLGENAFTHKWRTTLIWVAIIAILGAGAITFIKPTSSAISIPGTEAQKTLDRYSELFPGNGKGTARVVFEAPAGKTIQDFQQPISELAADIGKVDQVTAVITPFQNPTAISADKTIGYATVSLSEGTGSIKESTTEAITELLGDARVDGLAVEAGGDIINNAPSELLGVGEIAGVLLALVVLLITLGSLISAGMPILIALVTIGGSMAGLFALSQVIDINSTTPALAVMLGLAVGIDYSLFIVSRYKSLLLEGYGYKAASGRAIATAGNAVIFAAATVVIALAALSIVQIPFMTTMGIAGAATVAFAAIVAVTLIPALLGFAGSRIFGKKTRVLIEAAQARGQHHSENAPKKTIWYRWGAAITRHPIVTLVSAVVVIAIIALPVFSLQLGLPTDGYAAKDSTQRKAYDIMAKGFGEGTNGPLLLVVENLPAVTDADKDLVRQQLIAAAGQTPLPEGVTPIQARMQLEAQVEQYAPYYHLNQVAEKVAENDDVKVALPAQVTDDGTKGFIQVIPDSAPASDETINLIAYIRDNQAALTGSNDITIGVTGSTALQQDINQKLATALPVYLATVVGLSLILLIIAFRSILIPLKATAGFLLSVLAMFGALVAVFQWGWFGITDAPGPIVSFIPILAIGILFGLAMDYEFFLVSSMHEAHLHTGDAKKAVVRGFATGSKVVTAAGVIMVSVFAGFISNGDGTIQAIGFGLAVGILIDAFLVRMTIVPAVMTLFGKAAWWMPKWLDRILPHISIEGEPEAAAVKTKSK